MAALLPVSKLNKQDTATPSPRFLQRVHDIFRLPLNPVERACRLSPSTKPGEALFFAVVGPAACYFSLLYLYAVRWMASCQPEHDLSPIQEMYAGFYHGIEWLLFWVVRGVMYVCVHLPSWTLGWAIYLGFHLLSLWCIAFPLIMLYWAYSTRVATRAIYSRVPSLPPSFAVPLRLFDHLFPLYLVQSIALFFFPLHCAFIVPYLPYLCAYVALTSLLDLSLPHLLLGLLARGDNWLNGVAPPKEGDMGLASVEVLVLQEELERVREENRALRKERQY